MAEDVDSVSQVPIVERGGGTLSASRWVSVGSFRWFGCTSDGLVGDVGKVVRGHVWKDFFAQGRIAGGMGTAVTGGSKTVWVL